MSVKFKYRLVIAALFFLFIHEAHGQKALLLMKKKRPYKVFFVAGDEMRFRLKGENFFNKGLIQGFEGQNIVFHYYKVSLDEIAEIDVSNKNFTVFSFRSGPGKLVFAGGALLAIDQFNQSVINHNPVRFKKSTLLVGAGLTASGFLLAIIKKKRWKLYKKKHQAKIVEYSK